MAQRSRRMVSAFCVLAATWGVCGAVWQGAGLAAASHDAGALEVPQALRLAPRQPGEPPGPLRNQGLVRVAYSDASTGVFLGSPAIARLDADTLLISHDFFPEWGPVKHTAVLSSKDGGASWQERARVPNQFWSSLFVHRGLLYLLGVDGDGGSNAVSISRSADGGATWNHSSLLRPPPGCRFATGAVPVLLEGGRLWRGMEYWCGATLRWPQDYHALLIHASEGSDLLDPASWRATAAARFNSTSMLPAWVPGSVVSGGFLEGNAVNLPGGGVGLLLRCRLYDEQYRMYGVQQACLYSLSQSGPAADTAQAGGGRRLAEQTAGGLRPRQQQIHPAASTDTPTARLASLGEGRPAPLPLQWQGLLEMPGGGNKFLARFDPASRLYLALTNPSIDRYGSNPDARNILVLTYSPNLIDWRIATTVLVPNDGLTWEQSLWHTGYQYADWLIDGEDMLAAVRTAYDGANSFHNSNQITFKRVERYRRHLPRGA